MNTFTRIASLTILLLFITGFFVAYAQTFSEEPQTLHQYDDDNLAAQMGAKEGLPPCMVLALMAGEIQKTRTDSGDDYETFHANIEKQYPDRKTEYDADGNVTRVGHVQIVFRRQVQYMGTVVYSMDESLKPNVVTELIKTQCMERGSY